MFHSPSPYPTHHGTEAYFMLPKAKAVLVMDNSIPHVAPETFGLLGENHIKIVTFASYATNIFHTLDLSFFGVFKTRGKLWMD
jgi:hypothetical protein